MTDRRAILGGVIAVALSGVGLVATANRGSAATWELVQWKAYDEVGNPPYTRPLLIEFAADWCLPCYRMRITTFRDPAFVAFLKQFDLEAVRAEEKHGGSVAFREFMKRFRVAGFPTFVLVGRDGRWLTVSEGQVDTETLRYRLWSAYRRVDRGLYWIPAQTGERIERPGLVVKSFDKWYFVDSGSRRDWRWSREPRFVQWANANLTLIDDEFDRHMDGVAHYRKHHIRAVPTVLVFTAMGKEVLRLEGEDAIADAPRQIARVARANGLATPDPPAAAAEPSGTTADTE